MSNSSKPSVQLTATDIDVGVRLVEALVRHVEADGPVAIGFADLLERGRLMYPHDATLARAVPVGIRPKLQFVEGYCNAHAFPALARLVVKDAAGAELAIERQAFARADWSAVLAGLEAYAEQARAALPRNLKPRKERPAEVAWYAYFCSHREACAKLSSADKHEIVNMLMAGLDPDTALKRFQAAQAEFGAAT